MIEECEHTFIPYKDTIKCCRCDWQPSRYELCCYLNTGEWEWHRCNQDDKSIEEKLEKVWEEFKNA